MEVEKNCLNCYNVVDCKSKKYCELCANFQPCIYTRQAVILSGILDLHKNTLRKRKIRNGGKWDLKTINAAARMGWEYDKRGFFYYAKKN